MEKAADTMTRRTRVLVVNDSLNLGGAERVAVDIANTLDRDRFRVWFCSTRTGGPLEQDLASDIEYHVLGRNATWDLTKLVPFARLVRRNGIDVIHSHARGTMKFVSLARALRIVSVPHVFHDHYGGLHADRSADAGLRLALHREVDTYIGVDRRLCTWAEETVGLDPRRIRLVRNGIDLRQFRDVRPRDPREVFGLPPDSVVAVMVANFKPQKDHPTVFRAVAELEPKLRERFRLVICGSTSADSAYLRGCTEMVTRLGLDDVVHLVGARDDVAELCSAADFGIHAAKNETGPLVVLEYMAAGLPFIATDTGEITRALRGQDVGFLPTPRDHFEMADALTEMLVMEGAARRAMGERGRDLVRNQFAQPVVTAEIERLYAEVIDAVEGPAGDRAGALLRRPTP
jgi:glycosyltransferase involved in cell wall biosynthesis